MNIAPHTLYDLQEFINSNPSYFNEDEKISINLYLQTTTEKYADGKYWLKGQLQISPNDEITNEKMREADDIDKRRQIEYGGPCNGLEAASIRQHTYTFENQHNSFYDLKSSTHLNKIIKNISWFSFN